MSLIKNSIWNLAGYIIPTIITIPALGYIARILKPELFGIYTLAIAMVGYASIFDVGLTRAIVREIALYRDNHTERKKIIATATIFILCFSITGVLIIYKCIPGIVTLLKVSSVYYASVVNSLKILVISIPIFLLNQLWMSILEGDESFGILNIQRSLCSSLIAGLPAVFLFFQPHLEYAILGLLLSRILSLIISFVMVRKDILQAGINFSFDTFKRLIFFGGWITVSNIISPIMVYFDRFIISNLSGAKVVGFYTAPSEAVTRLGVLPAALARALFPRLSNSLKTNNFSKELSLSYKLMLIGCLPPVILGCFFSSDILGLWLGGEFAKQSSSVLVILLIGFLFNAIAYIPFAAIQSLGKAKLTAILHCIEVIPYLLMLYFFVKSFGIIGAAYAWSIRVIVDLILLTIVSKRIFNDKKYFS